MYVLCLTWHRICSQMLVLSATTFCIYFHLSNFRVVYTCNLNYFTFYSVLSPLNSSLCPQYTTETGMVWQNLPFLISLLYAAPLTIASTWNSLLLWFFKLHTSASHLSLSSESHSMCFFCSVFKFWCSQGFVLNFPSIFYMGDFSYSHGF